MRTAMIGFGVPTPDKEQRWVVEDSCVDRVPAQESTSKAGRPHVIIFCNNPAPTQRDSRPFR
jgi:hypothetical protein